MPLDLVKPVVGTIPEYFAGKNIFVTGFTGFLGKFLVQKLLTDCPRVGKIYVLLRPRKCKDVEEKLGIAMDNLIFEHLKNDSSKHLSKIIPIEGDISKLNLGISEEDRKTLVDNVHIVYHVAATVRFDMALTDAIIMNVRGTRDVANLALSMKKCEVFLHVSTAYCQIQHQIIEEKFYPSPIDWRWAIEMAENLEKAELSTMSSKIVAGYPNTYTFTKGIAEDLVRDLCSGKIQAVVCRPTIVVSAKGGPVTGWTDNFNGPVGILCARGKGLVRISYFRENTKFDNVPVDFIINDLIKATFMQQFLSPKEPSVYNCSNDVVSTTLSHLRDVYNVVMEACPYEPLWHADKVVTGNANRYLFETFFFHVIPAFFIDLLLRLMGKSGMFVKIQRRIYVAVVALSYFLSNEWKFVNDKCAELGDYLQQSDRETFKELEFYDFQEYFLDGAIFVKKNILKEDCSPGRIDVVKRKFFWFSVIHNSIKYTSLSVVLYWAAKYLFIPCLNGLVDYWKAL